jgi:hypothetical protein
VNLTGTFNYLYELSNPISACRCAGRQPRLLPHDLSSADVERLQAEKAESRYPAMKALMLYAHGICKCTAQTGVGRSGVRNR